MNKKFISSLAILFVVIIASLFFLTPQLRNMLTDQELKVVVQRTSDACGEVCVSFKVLSVYPDQNVVAADTLIYPYAGDMTGEQLFADTEMDATLCLVGISHRFHKGFGSLFKVGHGGYRFLVRNVYEDLSLCEKK